MITFDTVPVVIPDGQNFAKLDIISDTLAVFETNARFDLTDEQSFMFRGLDRACRLIVKKDGFQFRKLKVMRPPGVSGEIRVSFAVGDGVEFIDGRLQYTSDTTNAPTFNIATVNALPVPALKSRFLGDFSAYLDATGAPRWYYDAWAKPAVVSGVTAGRNLIAPDNAKVTKRTVRLLTAGVTLNLGTDWQQTDIGNGFVAVLSDSNPEVTIDGGAALYATASAAADCVVLETVQADAAMVAADPAPGAFPGGVSTSGLSTFNARSRVRLRVVSGSGVLSWSLPVLNTTNGNVSGTRSMRKNGVTVAANGSSPYQIETTFKAGDDLHCAIDVTGTNGGPNYSGGGAGSLDTVLGVVSGEATVEAVDLDTGLVLFTVTRSVSDGLPATNFKRLLWDASWTLKAY